ncbi:hypothetical protein APA_5063 [Pseudanabaena sp. lw0831]|nr:hypothetical protein APA_5063 [Pseudanabaena sp. lw0831]
MARSIKSCGAKRRNSLCLNSLAIARELRKHLRKQGRTKKGINTDEV